MSSGLLTAREQLIVRLMQDLDGYVKRVEAIEESLGPKIQEAIEHAAGSAFSTTKSNIEAVIDEQEQKLEKAGTYAAALIGNQLNGKAALIATTADHAKRGRLRFVALVFVVALAAGALGGFIGTRIALELL